jgi:predicted Zn-dependent protease
VPAKFSARWPTAIWISPRSATCGFASDWNPHLLRSHTDEAIVWLEKARTAIPTEPALRSRLASAYALRDETERAAAELTEAQRLTSDDRYAILARLKALPGAWLAVPKIRALYEATYFAGLRKAGIPEE